MISQSESSLHILSAAAISAALLGYGLRGAPPRQMTLAKAKRLRRWPSILGGAAGAIMSGVVALADDVRPWEANYSTFAILLVAVLAMIAGVIFIRVGLRGRRVGDHPYCRACGFDLFGKPDGVNVCGECGKPLDTPAAVIIGERHRRMVPIYLGLFAIIAATAFSIAPGRAVYEWAREKNWSPLKPTWWLISQLNTPKVDQSDLSTLFQRANEGSLSQNQLRSIIDQLVLRQPTASPPTWISRETMTGLQIMTAGWTHGLLDERDVRSTLQWALASRLSVAPRAAAGHVLRYEIQTPPIGLFIDMTQPAQSVQVEIHRFTFNGEPLPLSQAFRSRFDAPISQRSWDYHLANAIHLPTEIPRGKATFEIQATLSMSLPVRDRPTITESRDVLLTGTTQIVDAAELRCPPVTHANIDASLPIDDPQNVAALQNALPSDQPDPLPRVEVNDNYFLLGAKEGKPALAIYSQASGSLLGEAVLRVDGKEKSLGPCFIDATTWGEFPVDAVPTGPFEVVIRPIPELGAELFDVVPTYRHEVVLHGRP